jgi:hypothetical protein
VVVGDVVWLRVLLVVTVDVRDRVPEAVRLAILWVGFAEGVPEILDVSVADPVPEGVDVELVVPLKESVVEGLAVELVVRVVVVEGVTV